MAEALLKIDSPLPRFGKLPGVDGKSYSWEDFKTSKVLVIVFSCNHCPYVQAYEGRMIAIQEGYRPRGVRLLAINSNETEHYPEDNFDEMVKRAKSRGFNFPYVRDEDQSVAGEFGATHTPEFFVFAAAGADREQTLRYHGKMDDNYQNPAQVKHPYLRAAVDAILAGKTVPETETHSIGCTIKWKT